MCQTDRREGARTILTALDASLEGRQRLRQSLRAVPAVSALLGSS